MDDYKTWEINRHITMVDDGGALTFDLGTQSLSLLPPDVPKVLAACAQWLDMHQPGWRP